MQAVTAVPSGRFLAGGDAREPVSLYLGLPAIRLGLPDGEFHKR
jgi:hypothetical protein